jgi:putative membrane protein
MKAKYFIMLALLAFFGCNKDDNNDSNNNNSALNTQDNQFMAQIKEANLAEIDAGQTATSKGNNAGVRYFGQFMVTEHTTAKTSLDSLAGALYITLSDTLSPEHKALKQTLTDISGYAFDTTYMGAQVRDHQKVIQMFQTEIQSGKHSAVKGYANRFLPHIQMHLTMADSIKATL